MNDNEFYSSNGKTAGAAGFETLVESCYQKILYHCVKKVKNLHLAQELTQETFLKAFINFEKLENKKLFVPWLFKICKNEIRQNIRSDIKSAASGCSDLIQTGYSYSDASISRQYEKLHAAISLLSESHREAIILKYFCGFRIKQITALTAMSEKLIKSRLYEARNKLSVIMKNKIEISGLHNIYLKRRQAIMDKIKLMEIGSYVFSRLSLKTQRELLNLAQNNQKFSETALVEIGETKRGREFVKECDGRLSRDEITLILSFCDEETIKRLKWESMDNSIKTDIDVSLSLKGISANGYLVNAVDIMFKTPLVEDTLKWYEKTLGWKAHRGMFDENNDCCYGCVTLDEKAPITSGTRSFHGFHISKGESCDQNSTMIPLVTVDGLERLYETVKKSGWKEFTKIKKEEWGSRTITVKDINGYTITFMEWPPEVKNPYCDEQ